jgi:hypothetical protein
MSSLSMFGTKARYVGAWTSVAVYNQNEIVYGSNGKAYRCIVSGTTGSSFNPTTDTTKWEVYIPGAIGLTTATQTERTSTTPYGINAGSTWQWRGAEWTLEKTGTSVSLIKMKQNCNCNCNCDCSGWNCDCASACGSDCNCYSDCGHIVYDCVPYYVNCGTDCDCATNCSSNCDCAGECNCNCTPI